MALTGTTLKRGPIGRGRETSISRGSRVTGMLAEIRQTELGWAIYLACRGLVACIGSYGNRPTKTRSRGLYLPALPCSLAQAGGINHQAAWYFGITRVSLALSPSLRNSSRLCLPLCACSLSLLLLFELRGRCLVGPPIY